MRRGTAQQECEAFFCNHPDLHLYATRHTFITRALSAGVPIAQVAGMVGNSIVILEKHYAHLDKANSADMFAAVNLATAKQATATLPTKAA